MVLGGGAVSYERCTPVAPLGGACPAWFEAGFSCVRVDFHIQNVPLDGPLAEGGQGV